MRTSAAADPGPRAKSDYAAEQPRVVARWWRARSELRGVRPFSVRESPCPGAAVFSAHSRSELRLRRLRARGMLFQEAVGQRPCRRRRTLVAMPVLCRWQRLIRQQRQ